MGIKSFSKLLKRKSEDDTLIENTEIVRSLGKGSIASKTLAMDGMNMFYQFSEATKYDRMSYQGFFNRTVSMLQQNTKPIWIFDYRPTMRSWPVIEKCINLLQLMGCPAFHTPGSGEGACSVLCKEDKAWAVVSRDYDPLVFGAPRLIPNLNAKMTNLKYYHLESFLKYHEISQAQLIDIAILCGNDFFKGVSGIGPATALKLIKKYIMIEELPKTYRKAKIEIPAADLAIVRKQFKNPHVKSKPDLTFRRPKIVSLIKFFEDAGLSVSRLRKQLRRLQVSGNQTTLEAFI